MKNKGKLNGLLLLLSFLVLTAGIAWAVAYPGERIMSNQWIGGMDANSQVMGYAEAKPGAAKSTDGYFPIAAQDGNLFRALLSDADGHLKVSVVSITGSDFSGPWDTTTGAGTKGNQNLFFDGTIWRRASSDTSGRLVLGATSQAISNVGITSITGANFSGADGTTAPLIGIMVGGYDGTDLEYFSVDNNGRLNVNIVDSLPAGSATIGNITATAYSGTAGTTDNLGANGLQVMGRDSGGLPRFLKTDTTGSAQVDIESAIPTGANSIGTVGLNAGSNAIGTVSVTAISGADFTKPDGTTTAPATNAVVAGWDGANIQTIKTDASGAVQVDIESAIPAGNNNIGDVDIASAIPAGANTIGDVTISSVTFDVVDGSSTAPGGSVSVAYFDGTNFQYPSSDSNGRANVNVVDALPAGTAYIGRTRLTDGTNNTDVESGRLKVQIFKPDDALSAVVNTPTAATEVAIATPGAGNYLTVVNCYVSTQNAGAVKIRQAVAGTVVWEQYMAAGQVVDACAGESWSFTTNQAVTIESAGAGAYGSARYYNLAP